MRRGRRLKKGKGSGLGDEYVDALFKVYEDRVSAEADFVCYWFAKAFEAIRAERVSRVGLVATNSIRGGANRAFARFKDLLDRRGVLDQWYDFEAKAEIASSRKSNPPRQR